MKVWVSGSPGHLGGASGECLGAIAVWLRAGLEVGVIPCWGQPSQECLDLADLYGFTIHQSSPRRLGDIEGLAGAPVVNFCCDPAAKAAKYFKAIDCTLVAVPCMTFATQAFRNAAFDTWVFQSEFQRGCFKRKDGHVIRGGIDWWNIPFQPLPHAPGDPFVLARVARGHEPKWSSDLYSIYERVPNRKAILLGVSEGVARRLGRAPEWAATYGPGDIPAAEVYRQTHCYLSANGEDRENWPRVGLEAMAYGVPIVAENKWGWREMITHGADGWLYDAPEQASQFATDMANNEGMRLAIAKQARHNLETRIANPATIWEGWAKVFGIEPQSSEYKWDEPGDIKADIQRAVETIRRDTEPGQPQGAYGFVEVAGKMEAAYFPPEGGKAVLLPNVEDKDIHDEQTRIKVRSQPNSEGVSGISADAIPARVGDTACNGLREATTTAVQSAKSVGQKQITAKAPEASPLPAGFLGGSKCV